MKEIFSRGGVLLLRETLLTQEMTKYLKLSNIRELKNLF
jgi:hypothetical protein